MSTEIGLFAIFGLVQTWSFIMRSWWMEGMDSAKKTHRQAKYALYTEALYIGLSLVAKTILGAGIIVGNFVNSSN